MAEDFYPFVDSGDPTPDNEHLTGVAEGSARGGAGPRGATPPEGAAVCYATRISVYDDMLSTPRVIVVEQADVRTYLEDVTNTVHRTMKEQGGHLSLMVIRELVENFIHAQFIEPVISILDNGDTIRFADQGPGIDDKERAFEFGVTSADRSKKRYIRGTGAGLPMVQQYIEAAGGAISVEDNLGAGTVVTVSVDPKRVSEIEAAVSRGAAVRGGIPRGAAYGNGMYGGEGYSAGAGGPYGASPQPASPGVPYGGSVGGPYAPNAVNPYGANPYGGGANPYGNGVPHGASAPVAYAGVPYGAMVPAPSPGTMANQQANAPTGGTSTMRDGFAAAPELTERGRLAIGFITENEKGGPTDLSRAFGYSEATWSRELDLLAGIGLIHKRGQKYTLTEVGRLWSSR